MPNCTYCGEHAGFLKWWHGKCRFAHREALESIGFAVSTGLNPKNGKSVKDVERKIKESAYKGRVSTEKRDQAVLEAWRDAVEQAFEDNLLSTEEQKTLENFAEHFRLSPQETAGSRERIHQGEILREIVKGRIPEFQPRENLPFNLQKSEKVAWVFEDVEYYKQKTVRSFRGGSRGVSVRVAKGVYMRAGAFKGRSITETENQHIDTGTLAFTTKHLYFNSPGTRFRIRWNKIMAFDPMEDGLGIQRDNARAKPESFINDQGWFTYNLAANLARLGE